MGIELDRGPLNVALCPADATCSTPAAAPGATEFARCRKSRLRAAVSRRTGNILGATLEARKLTAKFYFVIDAGERLPDCHIWMGSAFFPYKTRLTNMIDPN
jgi:hypothetical protein